jgi:uncharacterized protein (DUF924 family)/quercetin dioxygenase-like cupin family protein
MDTNDRKRPPIEAGNLFAGAPARLDAERFDTLVETEGLRLERIVSTGQTTPAGEWFDQDRDEWVVLLAGAAEVLFEGEAGPRILAPGDWLRIPARVRHRVARTDPDRPTVWLALHHRPPSRQGRSAARDPAPHPATHESGIDRVLSFWFDALRPEQWFAVDETVDDDVRTRFGPLHRRLAGGVPPEWEQTPEGCLAAVIVLDQFPRNMFRGEARAFATDAAARALSDRAIGRGFDRALGPAQRKFLYMPFQHGESAADQARSVDLFAALDDPQTLDFARRHKQIVDRFGRFPHRNAVLGRVSTAEELEFLQRPDSSF